MWCAGRNEAVKGERKQIHGLQNLDKFIKANKYINLLPENHKISLKYLNYLLLTSSVNGQKV